MSSRKHAGFPSRSDVRAHAAILGLCLALTYIFNLATPGLRDRAGQIKGTDFANFYALGSLALNERHEVLYDRTALAEYSTTLLPDLKGTVYLPIYGPQVALFFAPFALLPYGLALALWTCGLVAMFAVCCRSLWQSCPNLRGDAVTVAIVALASPAFFNLVAHGQNSAVALLLFTAMFFALRQGRHFIAGLALGSLIFKPQLGLVAGCVFVLSRDWRAVAGAIVGAAIQLGLAWVYFGSEVMAAYLTWLQGVGEVNSLLAIKLYQMHSLYALFKLAIPSLWVATMLYLVSAAICTWAAYVVWRSHAPLALRYAFLLLATVLASPHLYVYDLVILAPMFLFVIDHTVAESAGPLSAPIERTLYFAYSLPLAGVVAQMTHLQLSVIAMTALAILLFRDIAPQLSRDARFDRAPRSAANTAHS
jgi:hypothetical protein